MDSLSILVTHPTSPAIIILGGGLAGLTVAYRLASQGARVTLLDQHSRVGGRAIQSGQGRDSAPLTASNSHQATWVLWRSLQSHTNPVPFTNVPLEFLLPDGRTAAYPYTPLPMPVHPAMSLLRFNGLTWPERWRLVSWLEQVWEGAAQLPSDLTHRSADEWLASLEQGDRARRITWNPLAQWLTGNQLMRLSVDAFCAAIEPIFLRSASESRWAVAPSLHGSLVQPMLAKLQTTGATILLDTEATQLLNEGDRVTGVLLRNGSTLQGRRYVASLPPHQLAALLPERWLSRYAYFQQLAELTFLPRATMQVIIPRPLTKPRIVLLSHGPFHSVMAHPSGSDYTICRFVCTDGRADSPSTPEALHMHAENILRSLQLLSNGETALSFRYQREEDGILSLEPGMQLRRPLQQSPIANLLLAGAWTDTGWPPNLESAIVSGERCADVIGRLSPRHAIHY